MSKAKHAPTTRRSLLAGAVALVGAGGGTAVTVVAAAHAAEAHVDRAVLALEPEIHRLAASFEGQLRRLFETEDHAGELAMARCATAGIPCPESAWDPVFMAAYAELGGPDAEAESEVARTALYTSAETLGAMRAVTLDGMRAKARVATHYPDIVHSILEDLLAMDSQMPSTSGMVASIDLT